MLRPAFWPLHEYSTIVDIGIEKDREYLAMVGFAIILCRKSDYESQGTKFANGCIRLTIVHLFLCFDQKPGFLPC